MNSFLKKKVHNQALARFSSIFIIMLICLGFNRHCCFLQLLPTCPASSRLTSHPLPPISSCLQLPPTSYLLPPLTSPRHPLPSDPHFLQTPHFLGTRNFRLLIPPAFRSPLLSTASPYHPISYNRPSLTSSYPLTINLTHHNRAKTFPHLINAGDVGLNV